MRVASSCGVDVELAARLLSASAWLESDSASSAAATADILTDSADPRCGQVFADLVRALVPLRAKFQDVLAGPVREALVPRCDNSALAAAAAASAGETAVGSRPRPSVHGAAVAAVQGRGRALLVGSERLERGTVVLRDWPLEWVPLLPAGADREENGRVGPGGLAAETALALRLWQADRLGHVGAQAAGRVLMSHGGGDAPIRLQRAVVAAACVMASGAAGNDVDTKAISSAALALFAWLGRVRVNTVAASQIEEADGLMVTSKNVLALFPATAVAVNHDCRPNAVLLTPGSGGDDLRLEIRVCSKAGVGPGEEVTISYGPLAARMGRAERRSALIKQYGFECACVSCQQLGQEDFAWRQRAEELDARARDEAHRERWRAAAVASSAALAALRQGYSAGDLELAREECKLAGLLARAGDVVRARESWASAATMLRGFVEPGDPDLVEAEQMLQGLPSPLPFVSTKDSTVATCATVAATVANNGSAAYLAAAATVHAAHFRKASSRGEFDAALKHMCSVMEDCRLGKSDRRGLHTHDNGGGTTRISDDFKGVILGLDALQLSSEEKARLEAAVRGPL
eukprot:TRINITY_DN33951_c0_g1_i1.p1 TRINITY_DN33951_c0_g1~~TRINITY_DN33951_c0_g1_i1.p1  ORF type:complete len:577 (-),score=135.43 TRINITY_DN33951_c0_g1_i1:37-1767(-)